jgi:hypothetical protein
MAAVHRLVLTGRAPDLARFYPSAGGDAARKGAWEAFRRALEQRGADVAELVLLPCQTNEVGRSAALLFGFLEVAAATGLPLRVLEIGASAGLNLRFDRFHYGGGGASWGDAASPVDLTGLWDEPPEHVGSSLRVAERRGCDPRPIDPTSPEGRLSLSASIWADQTHRFDRLRGALELAARVPAAVDAASVEGWLPERLAALPSGAATVVYQSVVDEYLSAETRTAFHACLRQAGARATASSPLAWVRVEPVSHVRHHGVRVVTWPGGDEKLVAVCGAHGTGCRPTRR